MKLLFVSSTPVDSKSSGGGQCTNRNYLSLCEIVGHENVEVILISSKIKKSLSAIALRFLNYLIGFNAGMTKSVVNDIITASKRNDIIFLDNSEYGIISYYLKKHHFKGSIICFFHDVKFNIMLQKVKANPLKIWKLLVVFYNERNALRYSDKLVNLCKRDSNLLSKIYKNNYLSKTYIIPISFFDGFKSEIKQENELTNTVPTFLFIGNYWYANVHGLRWFVNNVLEHANIKLQIVGSGMDVLRDEFINPKIEFLGFVEDLNAVIEASDFIIAPLFKGGGMKVKICEALMYGKNIIATPEAFTGYELDYAEPSVIVCEDKEEFVKAFHSVSLNPRPKFSLYNRTAFLNHYSFEATLKQFKAMIED